MDKWKAIAKIVDYADVQNKCTELGLGTADKGAIWVNIPELGLISAQEMVYCRYGLSIPFIKVRVNDNLWVESTIEDLKRFIYTGFADCGNADAEPESTSQLTIPLEEGKFSIQFGDIITIDGDTDAKTLTVECGDSKIEMTNTAVNITTSSGNKVTLNGNLEVTKS